MVEEITEAEIPGRRRLLQARQRVLRQASRRLPERHRDGSEVDQWEWSGGSNQLWTITSVDSNYEITNKTSGKALDVYESSTADGGSVDQWTYSGSTNQLWSITAS